MTKFDNVRFKQFPDYQTNSCGWKPVRFMPKGTGQWFTMGDKLRGSHGQIGSDEVRNKKLLSDKEWNIVFNGFRYNQFALGKNEYWNAGSNGDYGIITKFELVGSQYSQKKLTFLRTKQE